MSVGIAEGINVAAFCFWTYIDSDQDNYAQVVTSRSSSDLSPSEVSVASAEH